MRDHFEDKTVDQYLAKVILVYLFDFRYSITTGDQ